MKYSVALCFDANYQVQTRTVMQTIEKYGLPDGSIDFYLIIEDKKDLCIDAFNSLESDRVHIHFICISGEYRDYISELYEILQCPKKDYISQIAIAKCLLPLLVNDCGKLLYLDSDMAVVDDISEIWGIDMEGYSIAAVPDLKLSKNKGNCGIQFTEQDRYFNSGLVLFNMNAINKKALLQDLKDVYLNSDRVYRFIDQDQLNVYFHDTVRYLPLKYNLFARFPYAGKECSIDITEIFSYPNTLEQMGDDVSFDDVKEALDNPKIVHFVTRRKPWNSFDGYKYELWRTETCKYNWSGYFLEKLISQYEDSFVFRVSSFRKFINLPGIRILKVIVKRIFFRRRKFKRRNPV